jgi:enoyl-CoA hydratase/carnithine racemase
VICAIHGACIGGALELALACDLRVLAADAIVGMPETRIGLIPDVGGSSRLPAVVGLGRAKELIMTGKLIGARGGRADRARQPRRARGGARRGGRRSSSSELLACAPVAVGLAKRVMDASARRRSPRRSSSRWCRRSAARRPPTSRRARRLPREARAGVQRA